MQNRKCPFFPDLVIPSAQMSLAEHPPKESDETIKTRLDKIQETSLYWKSDGQDISKAFFFSVYMLFSGFGSDL